MKTCKLSNIFIAYEAKINKSFVDFIVYKGLHNFLKKLSVLEIQENI